MVISYGVVYRETGNEYIVNNPTFGVYKEQPEDEISVQSMKLTFAEEDGDDTSLGGETAFENKSADAVTAL